jgi:uncharacterized protein involved in cysteine biosynthesis
MCSTLNVCIIGTIVAFFVLLLAGLAIAGLVIIPVLNLVTPVFATALMVRVHKRLTPTRELIEPGR